MAAVMAPGMGDGLPAPAPPRKRTRTRRRWIGAAVGAWIVVLGLLSWWSIRNDPATVPEQRSVEQSMPALRKAAGVLLAAAESAAGESWVVRLGAIHDSSCELNPLRDGVDAGRDVFLYVPQGQAETALEKVAAALPSAYRAGVVAARVGTRLSLFADAGDFVAVDARAQPDDQVLTLSASTGCRPGNVPGGSDPDAGTVPAALTRTVAALGGRADAEVSTQVVDCPEGGTAATYQATAGASGSGPRAVPDGVTPVWTGAGGWAYRQGLESFVVDDNGQNLRVSVTTGCGQ